jgi:hypothetical protein
MFDSLSLFIYAMSIYFGYIKNIINELITKIIIQLNFRDFKFILSDKNIPKMITIEHITYIIGTTINALKPGEVNKLFIISISITNNRINKMGTEGLTEVFFIIFMSERI